MGEKVTKSMHLCLTVFLVLTFFTSGFASKVFASQTGLPVNGISIEMGWNS